MSLISTLGPYNRGIDQDELARALRQGRFGDFENKSVYASCLIPFLRALGWPQDLGQLAESLPHYTNNLSFGDFQNVLATLGYLTKEIPADIETLDSRLFPCLFVAHNGDVYVIQTANGDKLRAYDGQKRAQRYLTRRSLKGHAYIAKADRSAIDTPLEGGKSWILSLFRRFKSQILTVMGLNTALGILGIAPPLFVMTVYDAVIPSHSLNGLGTLFVAIILILLLELNFQIIRIRILSYFGARLDYLIATKAFSRIVTLPASNLESASLGAQLGKLNEFSAVRSLFSGPFAGALFDLPLIFLFLSVIGILAGPLFSIPIIAAFLALCGTAFLFRTLRDNAEAASSIRAKRNAFLVETLSNISAIKSLGVDAHWLSRYEELSAEAAYRNFQSERLSFINQTMTQVIVSMAGIVILLFGVLAVLNETLTIGALIATMALVWRSLSPLQNILTSVLQLSQFRTTFRQIDALMAMKTDSIERSRDALRTWHGSIECQKLGFRYARAVNPSLMNINLNIQPGEFIVITGDLGAGKTTLLRVLCGLQSPQIGQIYLDGIDYQQIDRRELRHLMAFVPQKSHLFHGTISQNLRLARPTATDADLICACDQAGLLNEIEQLPDGLNTRLDENFIRKLGRGFRHKLALALAYVKQAPVLILDDPIKALDAPGEKALRDTLTRLKGTTTIILATRSLNHLLMADRAFVLSKGLIVSSGTPDQILDADAESLAND